MPKNLFICFLLLVFSSICLFAQDENKGQESKQSDAKLINDIEFIGLKYYKKEDVLKILKSKIGGAYDPTIWAEDKVILLKSGYFKEVITEEKIRNTYVRLIVKVEEIEVSNLVKSIKVVGLKKIPQEQILANMRTRVGHEFDQKIFDRDIVNLHNLSFSKDIKTIPTQNRDGYEITIYVAEDVDWYDTYKVKVKDGTNASVEKNLKEQVLLNKDGSYMDEANIAMACRRIKEFLQTKGFYFSDVQTETIIEKNDKVLRFIVTRGPKLKVAELNYVGKMRHSQRYLIKKARVGLRPMYTYATSYGFYQNKLEEDKVKLTQMYNTLGFINAKIEQEDLVYNGSRDRVYITFKINEGPRYYINEIKFVGNTLFEKEDLLVVLKYLPGSHFDGRAIMEDAKSIEGLYGDEGRLFTVVEPKYSFENDRHLVDITYSIRESGLAKIGKIIINGNDVTKETVILKEMLLFPGDTYDRYKFDKSKDNIKRLSFIDYQEVKVEVVQSAEDTGDIVISVKEKPSGSLTFRVMFTDNDQFTAGVSLSESNFDWKSLYGHKIKGGGQTIGVSADAGPSSQRYNFNFINPMIFDLPIRYDFNSYISEREYREYDNRVIGGKTGLSTRILGSVWWGAGYRYEDVKINDVSENSAQQIRDADKEYILSAFYSYLSYDKTNNSYIPSSGFKVKLEETVSETFALGERKFTSTEVSFSSYFTVANRIDEYSQKKYPYYFAFHCQSDSTFYYGGDSLILSEAYLAGGNTTIRGFKPNRIGLRDEEGRLYPGSFRVVGNFEFNMPLYQDIVYLAPFIDAGAVWEGVQDFDSEDIRVSTGVTFKFRLPALQGQPILLTFAKPIHEKNDEKQYFAFSFMTAF